MKRWDFDLQLFAGAPSAELVSVGLGKETVFGAAVAPSFWVVPSSEGYDGTNDLIERPGARSRVGQTEQLTGLFTGKGSMMIEVDPDSFGAISLLTFGVESFAANPNNPSAQAVSTTVADVNGTKAGFGPMTPAAMTNIVVGQAIHIAGTTPETVNVRAYSGTQFWAYFQYAHNNGAAITNATVVNAYDHTFTLGSPRYSFTAEINHIVAAKRAFGCQMSSMGLKLTPKAVLEANCAVEYHGELHKSGPASPVYSTLRGLVFNTPGNAITFNGIPLDSSVQGVDISIPVGLIADYPSLGQGRYRGQLPETQTKAGGSFDLAFESETARQYFWGNAGAIGPQSQVLPVPVVITLQSVDYINTAVPYQLQIIIPQLKIKTAPEVMKVGDYIKQTVQWTCSESINGAGDDVKFILTNASNAASL